MRLRGRNSIMKTEGIFKLAQDEKDEESHAETGSVSTQSSFSFPTTVSNDFGASLGILTWDDQLEAVDEAEPKLGFGNLRVVGRDKEISQIRDAFDRAATGHSEAVEIYGCAGTGKSTLVEEALREYVADYDGLFVVGQFEKLRQQEPYSAIKEVFSDICDLILDSHDVRRVRKAIRKSMGSDAEILCRLIGENLSLILKQKTRKVGFEALTMYNAFSRLKILCRSFVRCVSSPRHPLVLFLEDVQFADKTSLKLLKVLLKDTEARNVLIVFSYREEEMTSDLVNLLSIFDGDDDEMHSILPCTEVGVLNMELDDVNEIVAMATNLTVASTHGLAEIVHRKTMGNVFFVIQYLEALQRDGFLHLSEGKWDWDLKAIQNDTVVSDNVAKLVTAKVKDQQQSVRFVLKLAACLGSRFDVSLLEVICYEQFVKKPNKAASSVTEAHFRERFAGFLSIADDEGLIEKCGKMEYKFCHDKVQRCLYAMIPVGSNRDDIHLAIGYQIMEKVRQDRNNRSSLVFLAADHLNKGRNRLVEYKDRINLVRLNLQAAKLAASQASFSLGSKYLKTSLELFDADTKWEAHSNLVIDIYSTLAEIEYCDGNFEASDRVCQEVIDHSPTLKKCFRVYYTMINSLAARDKFRAAMTLGFKVLRKMGESFPRGNPNMVQVMLEVAKVRLVLTEQTDEALLSLPVTKDEDVIAKMKLLSNMAACAYITTQHGKTFAMVALRMLQLTLRCGLTPTAPHAFATYATIQVFLGKYNEGFRFGQLTLRLIEKMVSNDTEARSLATVFLLVNHWRRPLREALPYFDRAFEVGRATGDIDYSNFSAIGKLTTLFYIGAPLKEAEAEIRKFATEMIDFKQRTPFRLVAPQWQLILNLMGKSDDPTELTGEAIDVEKTLDGIEEDENVVAIFAFVLNQMRLGYYFDNWDAIESIIPMLEGKYKANNNHFSCVTSVYERGLVYYELFRRTSKRAWKHKGHNMLAQLETWAADGVVSCHGMVKLLKAERIGFKADLADCVSAYDDAIQSFAAEGIIHQKAVAQERAASFFMERGIHKKALKYLVASMESYSKWGAVTKVRYMKIKFKSLLRQGNLGSP